MDGENLKRAGINEMFRLLLFYLCYISLILFGFGLLYATYFYLRYFVFDWLAVEEFSVVSLLLLLSIPFSLAICIPLSIYLIKPLFTYRRNVDNQRLEVTESDCPELISMIREVADTVKCKMPKHIYLTRNVNAMVFYNSSFWGLFFPVKKNLELGLGLFDGINVDELKSIVAHECGHFSQNGMRIGSMVNVANKMLYDLIWSEDWFSRFITKRWANSSNFLIRLPGLMTLYIIRFISRGLYFMYRFVQKGNIKLSRYMEYDADRFSCKVTDKETVVSSLCKCEANDFQYNVYNSAIIENLMRENKLNIDYFKGKDYLIKNLHYQSMPYLKYDELLKSPVKFSTVKRSIEYEDIWSTHPSVEDRIAEINKVDSDVKANKDKLPAWGLIPERISEKLTEKLYSLFRTVQNELVYLTDEDFKKWTDEQIENNFIDERLHTYYGTGIIDVDYNNPIEPPTENPFNEENANTIEEFKAKRDDYFFAVKISNGEYDIKEIKYRGEIYKRKDLPIEHLRKEVDLIFPEIQSIYKKAYSYIYNKLSADEQELYKKAFIDMYYGLRVGNYELQTLNSHRDYIIEQIKYSANLKGAAHYEFCSNISKYEEHLDDFIGNLDFSVLESYEKGSSQILKIYVSEKHNSSYSYNEEEVTNLFRMTEYVNDLINKVIEMSRRYICNTVKRFIE